MYLLHGCRQYTVKDFIKPYWLACCEGVRLCKNLLLKPIQWSPISSEILGPPKGFYLSTKNWLDTNQARYDNFYFQETYIEIYPSQTVYRSAPKTLEKKIHWKFKIEYQRKLPAAFVAVIPKGRLWVNKGRTIDCCAVITPDDGVLSDLSLEFARLPKNHSIFVEWKLPPVYYIEGVAAALTSAKANIYFHWMTDLLPRIELLRRSGIALDNIDKFIVNSYESPFQRETLAILGIPAYKIIESCKYRHIKAERLLAPSLPGKPGNPPLWVCEFLRQEFLENFINDKPEKVERLYISRSQAPYRKIINEAEVKAFLEQRGFRSVVLEAMTVPEEAALLASAKVVVAPHGSGVTNTIFCQPGTKIIEIFSPYYVNVGYWSMANQIGLDYYYLIGEGKSPREGVDPHLAGANILVNLDALSMLMKLADIE